MRDPHTCTMSVFSAWGRLISNNICATTWSFVGPRGLILSQWTCCTETQTFPRGLSSESQPASTLWQQHTASHEPPYCKVCAPNSRTALTMCQPIPESILCTGESASCIDSPHAAPSVTTSLSALFRLHLQIQPLLTQLLCDAATALSATLGTLMWAVRELHNPWGRLWEKSSLNKKYLHLMWAGN